MKKETLVKIGAFGLYVSSLTSCKRPTFTIRFLDEDGNVLQKENLTSGELPVYKKEIPTKEKSYFSNWEPKIERVEKDQDYIACFKKKDNLLNYDFNKLNILYKDVYFLGSHCVSNFLDDFEIDYRWFVNFPNYEYNNKIAKFAVIVNVLRGDFKDGIESSNKIDFLKNRLLCEDIVEIDMKPEYYDEDKNDISGGFLAYHEISYFEQKYDFILISLRGTRNSNEWSSNFDLGYDDISYYSKTGEHKEWDKKEYHKGFYIAAKRLLKDIREPYGNSFKSNVIDYVKSHSKNKNTILLITGHSRGAAIASIIGEYFENEYVKENPDKLQPKVFTYTFASPNTCDENKTNNVKSIFNIINNDDVVPMTPLNQWGFKRIGEDIITRSVLTDLSTQFKDKVGENYQSLKGVSGILNNVKARRSNFYIVNTNNENNLARILVFKSKEDAEKKLDNIKSLIQDNLKLPINYFDFVIEENSNEERWLLKIFNCKAALLKVLENILNATYGFLDLFSVIKNLSFVMNATYIKFLNDLLFETGLIEGFSLNLKTFIHPHDIVSYILLIDNYKN